MLDSPPDSRKKLILAAGKLFAEKGLDGVSTRDISQATGLNISLISYYFGGKEALYRECLVYCANEAKTFALASFSTFEIKAMTRETFRRDMSLIIQGISQVKISSPYMSALMMRELISGMPFAKEIHEEIFSKLSDFLLEFLGQAQAQGILKKDLHLPTLFISMVHAMDTYFLAIQCDTSFSKLLYQFPDNQKQYGEQIVRIFIDGAMT